MTDLISLLTYAASEIASLTLFFIAAPIAAYRPLPVKSRRSERSRLATSPRKLAFNACDRMQKD